MRPSCDSRLHKLEMCSAVHIDIDLKTPACSGFTCITSLRVARINDHRGFRSKHRPRVDVPESPVVETCGSEISHGCRRVIRMSGLVPDISVQDRNGIGSCVRYLER